MFNIINPQVLKKSLTSAKDNNDNNIITTAA